MGSLLICSVALVDGVVTLDGAFADIMLDGDLADDTLAGTLVTFCPASSSRDGGDGAFIVAGALVVICGVIAGAILAFADVTLAGAAVTLVGAFADVTLTEVTF